MALQSFVRTYENTWPATNNQGTLSSRGAQSTIQHGDLTISPVLVVDDSSFGAEVEGVDWSQPIPESLVRQLVELQDKYGVLIFRNTGLDNERHIAFSQQLGEELEVNPFFYGRENDRVGEPYLWDVGK